jgi:carbon monoxide dehydrogenase subunit G
MILRLLAGIAILVVVILVFAATRPSTFRVQRSIEIDAPPATVFALINDFHNWSGWAPQDKEDLSMQRTYSGAASGTGAISDWHSSGSAGIGRMSIAESLPTTRISVKTDFVKPFEAHNMNNFVLEPAGNATRVTWTMHGTNLYLMKVMGIFVNMDRVMGKHFEAGLHNLKTLAEGD